MLICGTTPDARRVAKEDPTEAVQRGDAFLDARATTIGHPDQRHAGVDCEILDLVDLLGVCLAERAAKDGEVLAVQTDPASHDRAETGDDAVGVRAEVVETDPVRAVSNEGVDLLERVGIKEVLDAFARRHLALLQLGFDRPFGAGSACFLLTAREILESFGAQAARGL